MLVTTGKPTTRLFALILKINICFIHVKKDSGLGLQEWQEQYDFIEALRTSFNSLSAVLLSIMEQACRRVTHRGMLSRENR